MGRRRSTRINIHPISDGPGIRPAARPVDTYSRPAQAADPAPPPTTNGWMELAGALSTVEPGLTRYAAEREERNETPDQTFNREIEWLSRNGLTNPEWKRLLNVAVASVSPATTSGTELPHNLTAGIEIYRQLHAKNPHFLREHLSDAASIDFFETVRVGVEHMGLDQTQAVLDAVRITTEGDEVSPTLKARIADVRQTLDDMQGSQKWALGAFGADIENIGMVAGDLEKMASLYIRRGMETEDALSLAAERIMNDHIVVKGRLLPASDRRMRSYGSTLRQTHDAMEEAEPDRTWLGVEPRPFGDVLGDYVQQAVEPRYPDDVDPDDVVLLPHGNAQGVFIVVDRVSNTVLMPEWDEASGVPPIAPIITLDDITRWGVERQQTERLNIRDDNVARHNRLQERRALPSGRAGAQALRREQTQTRVADEHESAQRREALAEENRKRRR